MKVDSEITYSGGRIHFMLLPGREIRAEIRYIADFDADHTHQFIISKVRQSAAKSSRYSLPEVVEASSGKRRQRVFAKPGKAA